MSVICLSHWAPDATILGQLDSMIPRLTHHNLTTTTDMGGLHSWVRAEKP
jgi:hypothetical protein